MTMSDSGWHDLPQLVGQNISLLPLSAEDVAFIRDRQHDAGPKSNTSSWRTVGHLAADLVKERRQGRSFPYVVRSSSGKLAGVAALRRMRPDIPRTQIAVRLAEADGRGPELIEAFHLLLSLAFDDLSCAMVEFRSDSLDAGERRIFEKIGAKLDATLRGHLLREDQTSLDLDVHSILAHEWPGVKSHLKQMFQVAAPIL